MTASNPYSPYSSHYEPTPDVWIPDSLTSGGDASSTTGGQGGTQTTTFIGVSDSTFNVQCWGLKPKTLHYAYLVDRDVSADCAPLLGFLEPGTINVYGSPLVSDADGKLTFLFHFRPEASPFTTKYLQEVGRTVAIIPFGQHMFRISSTDGRSKAYSFIESKSTAT